MFNNLIESSSHRSELKRRSSFFLFTIATYALLFVIAGVISIYAYDAKLNEPSTELTVLNFAPLEPAKPVATQPAHSNTTRPNNSVNSLRATRPVLIDSVNNPMNPPRDVSTIAPAIPPAPPGAMIGPEISDLPGGIAKPGNGANGEGPGNTVVVPNVGTTPPPAPVHVPPRIVKSSVVLNGKALVLPKPLYTALAKSAHAEGTVTVQVLIDEQGRVVSAKAVSGHPLLTLEAQKAAYLARFSPTMIDSSPVKVSGVITYNFILQR